MWLEYITVRGHFGLIKSKQMIYEFGATLDYTSRQKLESYISTRYSFHHGNRMKPCYVTII